MPKTPTPTGTPTKPAEFKDDKDILWFVKLWCGRCGLVSNHKVVPNKEKNNSIEYECDKCHKKTVRI